MTKTSQKNRRHKGPVRRDNIIEHVESLHSLIETTRWHKKQMRDILNENINTRE